MIVETSNFDKLIEPHRRALMGRAMKLCHGDIGMAEDMVQDTILKAFTNQEKFKGGNYGAWLMRILFNCVTSVFRRRTVVHENSCESPPDREAPPAMDFEISDELMGAIDSLPPDYKSVLLGSVGNVPYTEIAENLNIPVGTVMSRLWRARQLVRKIIDN